MADVGWFRNLGQRCRAPSHPSPRDGADPSGAPTQTRPSSPNKPRLQPAPIRVPSLLGPGLGPGPGSPHGWEGREGRTPSPTSTIATSTTGSSTTNSTPSVVNDGYVAAALPPNQTWHNPSLDQMVETIQVAMMTKRDSLAPIPVQFNAYILALIEGYSKQRRLITEAREEAASLQTLREKELEEFRAIAEEWTMREEAYRAEVRRLELIIAKTSQDGMETVALARSGSLVDRGARKGFQARLKDLGTPQEDRGKSPGRRINSALYFFYHFRHTKET